MTTPLAPLPDRASAHALRALLWSAGPEYDNAFVSIDLTERISRDWAEFRARAERQGFDAVEHRLTAIDPAEGDEWDYAAHDFILTRNRHGAGFWDGDWHRPWGDQLTALAHDFSEVELYVGDDGIVYST